MTRRTIRLATAIALGLLTLTACSGGDDSADMSTAGYEEPMAADEAADAYAYDASVTAPKRDAAERDLIVTMGIGLESDDVTRTVAVIETAVSAADGLITSSDIGYGDSATSEGWATMVVRTPPDRLDAFVEGLDAPATAARVISVNRSADDVTDQLIELDVRIENQRESVEAVRRLMVDATQLADVVMLERELNDRQTDLEIMLAQQASITDRVALATVTIDIYSPGTAPEPAGGVIDGFVDGWSAFVSAGSRITYLLAAASPFLGAFAIVVVGVIITRRRR